MRKNRGAICAIAAILAVSVIPQACAASWAPHVEISDPASAAVLVHTKRKGHKHRRYRRHGSDDVIVDAPTTYVETRGRRTWVDAPFTSVRVHPRGVWVRAPFVNIYVPR